MLLLISVLVVGWCFAPLPLAVAVGRSLRQSSPEFVPAKLVHELEEWALVG